LGGAKKRNLSVAGAKEEEMGGTKKTKKDVVRDPG